MLISRQTKRFASFTNLKKYTRIHERMRVYIGVFICTLVDM